MQTSEKKNNAEQDEGGVSDAESDDSNTTQPLSPFEMKSRDAEMTDAAAAVAAATSQPPVTESPVNEAPPVPVSTEEAVPAAPGDTVVTPEAGDAPVIPPSSDVSTE